MNWVQVYHYSKMRQEEELHRAKEQSGALNARRLRTWLSALGEQMVAWGQALLEAADAAPAPVDAPSR